jgi:hypothetical protein
MIGGRSRRYKDDCRGDFVKIKITVTTPNVLKKEVV